MSGDRHDRAGGLFVGDVHLWGSECPCRPTTSADGITLRHHSLYGGGWTESIAGEHDCLGVDPETGEHAGCDGLSPTARETNG